MVDIPAVTHVLIPNLVCIMHLIIALKIEELIFFKFTKNPENKFASSVIVSPNTCYTVCVKAINLQCKYTFIYFNFVPLFMQLPLYVTTVNDTVCTCGFRA